MSYLDNGRKPVEMIAELLRQNSASLIRLEFRAADEKQYHASLFATVGGQLRQWDVAEPAGALLQTAKPAQLVETIGRWGVLAMVVIHDGALLQVNTQQVLQQQQHYQRIVAARRQKRRFEKEKALADKAYQDINAEIIMAAGWDTSQQQPEREYWDDLQARKAMVMAYRLWLAAEIDTRTAEIAAYEAAGNPESGYGERTETFENIWIAGDPASVTIGTLKAGWQLSEISISVGPNLPAAATVAIDAGAANIIPAGLFKLDREVQYEIEPYESFTDDRPITFTVDAAGAVSGALRILVETSK